MRSTLVTHVCILVFTSIFKITILSAQVAQSVVAVESTQSAGTHNSELIRMFSGNAVVNKGEVFQTVVVMGGNAEVYGTVNDAVVIMGGKLLLDGVVHGDCVVLGGTADVKAGTVIHGNLVMIGGENAIDPGVVIKGDKVIIAAWAGKILNNITPYLEHCIFKGRFIALSLPWTLWILAGYIALMFVCAILFHSTFVKSIEIVNHKVLTALLIGILTPVAVGPVFVALSISFIGIPAIPAVILTLQGAMLIGIFAINAHTGKHLLSLFGSNAALPPIVFALIGSVLYGALMLLPFVGGFIMVVLTTVGTGAGVLAIFSFVKTLKYTKCMSGTTTVPGHANNNPVQTIDDAGMVVPAQEVSAARSPLQSTESAMTGNATFLQRLGAAIIDTMLVFIVFGMITKPVISLLHQAHDSVGSLGMIMLLAYFTAMWTWKQTTVGMIVFRLKVYRMDNTPLTFSIAVIRALGLLLS
ncbi:MAG: RDD family protein, partial [Fibrobacterota bacterium]